MAQPYMSQKDVPNYGAVPSFPATPLPVYYVTPLSAPPPRRRFGFFKTFIVAVALLELAWFSRHWFHWHWDRPGHRHVHISPDGHWDIDIAGLDHDAEGCAVWDHYDPDAGSHVTGEASTTVTDKLREEGDKFTFSIPTSSERYHFVSWGPIDKSSFEVVPVKSDKDQIVAEVEILKDSRGTARVCALPSTDEGKIYGVGIYSPRPYPHKSEDWPAFKVIVYVPVSSDGSQRNLNAFETRLGQFEHIFPDLSKSINFSKLHTSAANVPMTFESVVANSVHVSNANSPITGKLTSATSLTVNNANGPIRGDLTLTQAGDLSVHNANSPIDIKVHLKSGDFHPRPDYHLSVDNANSPIDLTIAEQPIGSGFFLKGSNAISAIRVHLNAAYEGEFKLSDVMKTPSVEFVNHKDPSGKGRERYLQFTKRGATTEGRIDWGRPDDPDVEHAPGSVTLSTVVAPLELYFD